MKVPPKNLFGGDFKLDFYICLWNFKNDLIGLDLIYFGDKIKGKKVSYAPSFGNIETNINIPIKILKLLKDFTISVRDINSLNIISKNLGTLPDIVLDPTFLIDNHLFEHKSKIVISEKFILIYMTKQAAEVLYYWAPFRFLMFQLMLFVKTV